MNSTPVQMTDRWQHRADPVPGQDTVYWHVLMHNYPQAVKLAEHAQQRLSQFDGLHMTPLERLHMTTMVAGPADDFTGSQLIEMVGSAAEALSNVPPIHVKLGRIWYHPEAIMLGISPPQALTPLREAAMIATNNVADEQVFSGDPTNWRPHITICYSTAHQDASPIIAALGRQLPTCGIEIDALSLVIQHGPERRWDWSTVATIHLTAAAKRP
jgi:2'-5' RNA ligase